MPEKDEAAEGSLLLRNTRLPKHCCELLALAVSMQCKITSHSLSVYAHSLRDAGPQLQKGWNESCAQIIPLRRALHKAMLAKARAHKQKGGHLCMMYKVGDDCPQAKYRLDEQRDGEDSGHGDHDQRHLLGRQPVRRCTNALFITLQALVLQRWYAKRSAGPLMPPAGTEGTGSRGRRRGLPCRSCARCAR